MLLDNGRAKLENRQQKKPTKPEKELEMEIEEYNFK